jgi:hypothetical protein
MTEGNFLVVCTDRNDGEAKLVLATRRAFKTEHDARTYAAGIHPSHAPQIVETLPVLIGRPGEE